MNRTFRSLCIAAALLTGMTSGCFSNSGPVLADVTGNVTFNGKPLPDAMVSFYPNTGERSAHGMTDAAGNYRLQFTGMKEGALVGEHQVKIEVGIPAGEGPAIPASKLPKLPAKYNQETELTAEVNRGSNTIDFDLESN